MQSEGLDVLVNNAGVMFTSKLETMTEEELDTSMNANLKSAALLTKYSGNQIEVGLDREESDNVFLQLSIWKSPR